MNSEHESTWIAMAITKIRVAAFIDKRSATVIQIAVITLFVARAITRAAPSTEEFGALLYSQHVSSGVAFMDA